jgi:hypothetical protein
VFDLQVVVPCPDMADIDAPRGGGLTVPAGRTARPGGA